MAEDFTTSTSFFIHSFMIEVISVKALRRKDLVIIWEIFSQENDFMKMIYRNIE